MITFVKLRILFEILSKMSQTFFYICIEFKKSKSEARNCGNSIGGHSRDAAWRENIFRERRQVS